MKKNIFNYILIFLSIFLFAYAGKELKNEAQAPVVYVMERPEPKPYIYPQWKDKEEKNTAQVNIPRVGRDFVGFKEALAFNESGRKYHAVNSLGFLGKYQFGPGTLRYLKVDPRDFLKNPELQEKVFKKYIEENRKLLSKEIKLYSGKYIHGIKITESGILAAAHLAGAGAVKKFLRSGGRTSAKDAYGTRIEDYLRRFANYDISSIGAEKKN